MKFAPTTMHKAENHVHCAVNIIYIFSKKVAKIITKLREGDGLLMHFLLSSLRLKIFMNHNIGRKSEAGGDLVLLQTFLLFKYLLIVVFSCQQAREHDHLHMKDKNVCDKVTAILTSIQRPGH